MRPPASHKPRRSTVYLTNSSTTAHSNQHNNLCEKGVGSAYYSRRNTKTGAEEHKVVHFSCGRADCPRCQRRKVNKLRTRLRHVNWNTQVQMWTITSDPFDMTWTQHWLTLKRRWHIVHRTLIRLNPKFRYFLVVEATKNAYPHIHLLTDSYIDWKRFRYELMKQHFGSVLQFETIPKDRVANYVTKYVSKSLEAASIFGGSSLRLWSQSAALLPLIVYLDPEGPWTLVLVDFRLHSNVRSFALYFPSRSSPDRTQGG